MSKIKNKLEYDETMLRIEELLSYVNDETPRNDRNLKELELLSALIDEYDEENFPEESPTLVDIIKLRMDEMGLNQDRLATLLNVSPSCLNDYLNGRCEPTLPVAREISKKLNIDANIVLGV